MLQVVQPPKHSLTSPQMQNEFNDFNDIAHRIQYIWAQLCAEYGISVACNPLILINSNDHQNALAERLAQHGCFGDVSNIGCNAYNQDNLSILFTTDFHLSIINNTTVVSCVGVFGMADILWENMKYDNETEMDMKYRCIECYLRHEIGHILSMNAMYQGVSYNDYNSQRKVIKDLEDKVMSSWRIYCSPEEQMRNYFELPLEQIANRVSGVTTDMMIDAWSLFCEI